MFGGRAVLGEPGNGVAGEVRLPPVHHEIYGDDLRRLERRPRQPLPVVDARHSEPLSGSASRACPFGTGGVSCTRTGDSRMYGR